MTITRQQVDAWDDEVDAAYKRGLHDGMKQERALWTLSKLGQEIEAQPEQEPVAWGFQNSAITGRNRWMMLREDIPTDDQYGGALWTPLYTSPPQRQPLSDEEIAEVAERMEATDAASSFWREFARAVEAAHGIGDKT